MGFDAAYASTDVDDDWIIDTCKSGSMTLVSRDRLLCRKVKNSFLVRTTYIGEQISEIYGKFGFQEDLFLSRCTVCNTALVNMDGKNDASPVNVPEHVLSSGSVVKLCTTCGRCYWKGTHYEGMRTFLRNIGVMG